MSAQSRELKEQSATLIRAIPETMRGYQAMMRASALDGALTAKVKELMALAAGIVARCEGCIIYHVENAVRQGATRDEVAETIGIAVLMGGGPATVFGGMALAAYDEATQPKSS